MSKVCREFDLEELISIFVTSIGNAKQNKNKTSTFDIKSVCSMAKDIIINDTIFLYCTNVKEKYIIILVP